MRCRRVTWVLASWAALVAVLVAALAPSLSHALASAGGDPRFEVCTAAGSTLVTLDAGTTDDAPASAPSHPFEHCPCCSLATHADAIPTPGMSSHMVSGLAYALPVAFLEAPSTLFAWVTSQPRAPPARS